MADTNEGDNLKITVNQKEAADDVRKRVREAMKKALEEEISSRSGPGGGPEAIHASSSVMS